jgi:hypothetical protein
MAMEKQPENFAETRCPKTCGASSEVTGGETPAAWIVGTGGVRFLVPERWG